MYAGIISLGLAALAAVAPGAASIDGGPRARPTIVMVHGAFADSSSWDGVIPRLRQQGYHVIAAANPLRTVQGDADQIAALLNTLHGPVVLVGHSYGGMVISNAAEGNPNVKALVYVAAFAPEVGESAQQLSEKFPGSTLGDALAYPVPLPGGVSDLYIEQAKFHGQFAADLPPEMAALMAVGQRPITDAALGEPSAAAAWRSVPSWFVYGTADRNIPEQVHAFMAERANAREALAVKGASHVVMLSHPDEVASIIVKAAMS